MSKNQTEKSQQTSPNNEEAQKQPINANSKKDSFGGLTPLTTAQIITLLVGTSHSNSSYGGY